jgi:hypothetical protein
MRTIKRKAATTDYVGAYLDLPSNYTEGECIGDDEDGMKVHDQHLSLVNGLSAQASPFIIILIILCLFMAAFMATHTSRFSHDFHIISDSLHDSHRIISLPQLRASAPISVQSSPVVEKLQLSAVWPGCLTDIPVDLERRHIVPPPVGAVTLVCCNTTKGMINIEVHPTWAPLGAERFLSMVKDNFFSTQVSFQTNSVKQQDSHLLLS